MEELASLAVRNCQTKMTSTSQYALNHERYISTVSTAYFNYALHPNFFSIESTDDYDLENPYHLALRKWIYAVRSNSFSDAATFEGGSELLPFANVSSFS